MRFSLIIPTPIFDLSSIEGTDRFPYRWRAAHFPALMIESAERNPPGKCYTVDLKIDRGKNRDRTKSYVSLLKLRIEEPSNTPTHKLQWIRDTGKFAYCNEPSEFVAVIPGNEGGWLIAAVTSC